MKDNWGRTRPAAAYGWLQVKMARIKGRLSPLRTGEQDSLTTTELSFQIGKNFPKAAWNVSSKIPVAAYILGT